MNQNNKYPVTIYKINKGISKEIIGSGTCEGGLPEPLTVNFKLTVNVEGEWKASLSENNLAVGAITIADKTVKEYIVYPASGGGIYAGTTLPRKIVFVGNQFPASIAFKNDKGEYHGDEYFVCLIPDSNVKQIQVNPGTKEWPFSIGGGVNIDVYNRTNRENIEYVTQSSVNEGDAWNRTLDLIIPDHN